MSIVLVGSTSGSITLQEPAVSGTTVLDLPTTSGTVLTSASSVTRSQLPVGSVLQVVQGTPKTDTFSTTSGSLTDITGMSVTITPTSASNRILVQYSIGQLMPNNSAVYGIALLRGSTVIGAGATAGVRNLVSTGSITEGDRGGGQFFTFLDSPVTTSATTYKLQVYVNGGWTLFINRSATDIDSTVYNRSASTITVMEIAT